MKNAPNFPTPAEIAALKAQYPRAFGRPWRERLLIGGAVVLAVFYFVYLCVLFDITPMRLVNGLDRLGAIFLQMIPPRADGFFGTLMQALLETIAMAFMGTLIAAILAVPLGFLAARNLVPHWLLNFSLRGFLGGIRGIDQLIWALVFVRAVGLGPLAGVLAMAVSDTGTLAKLFAEAVENADKKQMEGVESTGASRALVIRLGIVPQVLPLFLSQVLYFFESNTRSATILGVVGAGGIGLQLSERIKVREWDQVAFVIVMLVVAVMIIDALSGRLRRRLIAGAERRAED
jgi:phosphonate transport system permease protein